MNKKLRLQLWRARPTTTVFAIKEQSATMTSIFLVSLNFINMFRVWFVAKSHILFYFFGQTLVLWLVPGVSRNSLLPYKCVRNSDEFIRQRGIPAHPWLVRNINLGQRNFITKFVSFEWSGFCQSWTLWFPNAQWSQELDIAYIIHYHVTPPPSTHLTL